MNCGLQCYQNYHRYDHCYGLYCQHQASEDENETMRVVVNRDEAWKSGSLVLMRR